MSLRAFREIPRNLREWTRWIQAQDVATSDHTHDDTDSSSSSTGTTTKIWSFGSPSATTGVTYFAGDYYFHGTPFTPAGGTNVGTANSSYAAHAFIVLGAISSDMVVRVTGTSINDSGTRAASATEDLYTAGGQVDAYFETQKKWIGQISFSLLSGTGVIVDAGLCKYWDNLNTDYTVIGLEATWRAGAADTGADIQLLHHKGTGWTYSGGSGDPTPPAEIAGMNTDHVTEVNLVNNEHGAWKRTNLNTTIRGSASEGIIWQVTTGVNKAFELGNLEVDVQ